MDVVIVDPGDSVFCDLCNADKTDCPQSGGFMFQSKAICPDCCDAFEKTAKQYNELHFIRARCPPNKSFADWVRQDLR